MLLVLILALSQAQKPALPEDIPLSVRVNRAIALGVENLKNRQPSDGRYRAHEDEYPGGATALVAYTLVRSGVRKNDPELLKSLEALREVEFRTTYSCAVHLLLCESLRDPSWREAAQRSLSFLLQHQEENGVWSYPGKYQDSSNTSFALLGLRAARRMGLVVPDEAWIRAADGLKVFDHPSGGYRYSPNWASYAGVTAACLASHAVLAEVAADSSKVRAAVERLSERRAKAEAFMENHFDPLRNQQADGTWTVLMHFAYLWALERWCDLSGLEKLDGRDWYKEGATWLIRVQGNDGSFGRHQSLEETCFALLFLRRATLTFTSELAEIYQTIDRQRVTHPEDFQYPSKEATYLVRWWLAGAWPEREPGRGAKPLLLDPPFDPKDVEPRAGGKIAHREWEEVTLRDDSWTDLELLTDRVGDDQLWLLATEFSVKGEEFQELILWCEFQDGWDVWVDGTSISRERRRVMNRHEVAAFPLRLTPGNHRLVVLVEDAKGVTVFGAQLTSRDNGPLQAEVSLEPLPKSSKRP
jgi:prenyltransferase beta subunit